MAAGNRGTAALQFPWVSSLLANGNQPTMRIQQHPRNQQAGSQHPWDANQKGDMAPFAALFFTSIQQHDDKNKQHHGLRPRTQYLHCGTKLRAEQQILSGDPPPSLPPATKHCLMG